MSKCNTIPIPMAPLKMSKPLHELEGKVVCNDDKLRNTVRFAADIQEFAVLALRDYTACERQQCFYTSDDRSRIKLERETIITKMEREEEKENIGLKDPKMRKQKSSFRGLEFQTEGGSIQSQQRVWMVIDTVINEQEDQRKRKLLDSDRIASVSQSVSTESTLLALRSAIVDQEAAFKVYRNWAADNPKVFAATTA